MFFNVGRRHHKNTMLPSRCRNRLVTTTNRWQNWRWYKSRKYDFLVLSDHNVFTEFSEDLRHRGGRRAPLPARIRQGARQPRTRLGGGVDAVRRRQRPPPGFSRSSPPGIGSARRHKPACVPPEAPAGRVFHPRAQRRSVPESKSPVGSPSRGAAILALRRK